MATPIAALNALLNVIIFIFAAIVMIQVVKSASRFKSGDTGMLFRKLKTGFIVFFLFALILGTGSTLAYFDAFPAFMATGENFEMMILVAHVLLIISLIILLVFAKNFAEFSEKFSFK
jgi:hypothetical protein